MPNTARFEDHLPSRVTGNDQSPLDRQQMTTSLHKGMVKGRQTSLPGGGGSAQRLVATTTPLTGEHEPPFEAVLWWRGARRPRKRGLILWATELDASE
jgi:hypothetical protein